MVATNLNILPRHINLNIHQFPRLLARSYNFPLRIRDQHHLEPIIAHSDNRQTRSIDSDVPLLDNVDQHSFIRGRKPKRECVSIRRDRHDRRSGVDVALNKVTAKPHMSGDGALEVDPGADGKRAEVCAAEGFGGDADFEAVGVEGGYGETGSWGMLVGESQGG